jgi:hypothetical protein
MPCRHQRKLNVKLSALSSRSHRVSRSSNSHFLPCQRARNGAFLRNVSLKPRRRRRRAKYSLCQLGRRTSKLPRRLRKSETSLSFSTSIHCFFFDMVHVRLTFFRWAKPAYHKYTDCLLTIIEEKDRYRQALGFSKELGAVVNSGGQTVMDICLDIAGTLFLTAEDSVYTKDDLDELGKCVHNRVIA